MSWKKYLEIQDTIGQIKGTLEGKKQGYNEGYIRGFEYGKNSVSFQNNNSHKYLIQCIPIASVKPKLIDNKYYYSVTLLINQNTDNIEKIVYVIDNKSYVGSINYHSIQVDMPYQESFTVEAFIKTKNSDSTNYTKHKFTLQ